MTEAAETTRRPGFVVLREVGDDTWQLIGEVPRRAGLPARRRVLRPFSTPPAARSETPTATPRSCAASGGSRSTTDSAD